MKILDRKPVPGDGEEPKLPRPPGSNEPEPDVPEPDDETRELVKPVKARMFSESQCISES
jgi:hypothetical protein